MTEIKRPGRFVALVSLWFWLAGPAVILPVPFLLPMAYLVGAIPATVAGLLYAIRYRSRQMPSSWASRCAAGAPIGGMVAFGFFILVYLAMHRGLAAFEQAAAFRMELESAGIGLLGCTLIGSLGGALAAAAMPSALRELGQEPKENV